MTRRGPSFFPLPSFSNAAGMELGLPGSYKYSCKCVQEPEVLKYLRDILLQPFSVTIDWFFLLGSLTATTSFWGWLLRSRFWPVLTDRVPCQDSSVIGFYIAGRVFLAVLDYNPPPTPPCPGPALPTMDNQGLLWLNEEDEDTPGCPYHLRHHPLLRRQKTPHRPRGHPCGCHGQGEH